MSGNRLTKFLTILVLFSRASATAALKAAGVLSSLKTLKTRGLDTSVLASCRYRFSPSAKGCKMRACLVLVCTEPRCSMRAGPVSAVASLTGCTNFVKKLLPLSSVTRAPLTSPTYRNTPSYLGLTPLVNAPPLLVIARNCPASSIFDALFSDRSLLNCAYAAFLLCSFALRLSLSATSLGAAPCKYSPSFGRLFCPFVTFSSRLAQLFVPAFLVSRTSAFLRLPIAVSRVASAFMSSFCFCWKVMFRFARSDRKV